VNRGFTLLEVMVAMVIMAVAVTALLGNLSTSMRTARRLTDHDRAAMLAKAKMDELLLDAKLPHGIELQGPLDAVRTGWRQAGWRAQVRAFDMPPGAQPGVPVLERIGLEVWWDGSGGRRTFRLEAFRRGTMMEEDMVLAE
jgi:general secretion pathway protein I